MSSQLSDKIIALKAQFGQNLCILGHHYQPDYVLKHCDIVGDSLELSRKVPDCAAEVLIFCGVSFMGESAALLAKPNQKVYLPDVEADCMMALMAGALEVDWVLKRLGTCTKVLPLAYVNTPLSVKAVVGQHGGAVCTSANAKIMLKKALEEAQTVLFLPDKHLGRNTAQALGLAAQDVQILRFSALEEICAQKSLPRLLLWPGCCPVHGQCTKEHVQKVRAEAPSARIYVHPECPAEVVQASDGAGSTTYLIKKAQELAKLDPTIPLYIGTENTLVYRLKNTLKTNIAPLFTGLCPDMQMGSEEKLFTLLNAILCGQAKAVNIEEKEREPAQSALTRMLKTCEQQ